MLSSSLTFSSIVSIKQVYLQLPVIDYQLRICLQRIFEHVNLRQIFNQKFFPLVSSSLTFSSIVSAEQVFLRLPVAHLQLVMCSNRTFGHPNPQQILGHIFCPLVSISLTFSSIVSIKQVNHQLSLADYQPVMCSRGTFGHPNLHQIFNQNFHPLVSISLNFSPIVTIEQVRLRLPVIGYQLKMCSKRTFGCPNQQHIFNQKFYLRLTSSLTFSPIVTIEQVFLQLPVCV